MDDNGVLTQLTKKKVILWTVSPFFSGSPVCSGANSHFLQGWVLERSVHPFSFNCCLVLIRVMVEGGGVEACPSGTPQLLVGATWGWFSWDKVDFCLKLWWGVWLCVAYLEINSVTFKSLKSARLQFWWVRMKHAAEIKRRPLAPSHQHLQELLLLGIYLPG